MIYKIISRTLILIAVLFLVTSIEVSAQDDFTDVNPEDVPELPNDIAQDVIVNGDILIFDDEVEFNNTCGGFPIEDFSETNVGADTVLGCPNPFNSLTDNACFSPGDLIPGFSITDPIDPNSDALVVLTPAFFGATSVAVGANTFTAPTRITFTEFVDAVGMVLVSLRGNTNTEVQVFGAGNVLLGTATVNLTSINGHFLGVQAEESITRIDLVETGPENGTLLYELSFGQCVRVISSPIPTLSEWGLLAMASILGIVGFMVIRRRKLTA